MKYSFLIGLVLGFVGLLGAAGGYPWVQHARVASRTEVVPNGGRAEHFTIRLPADRIGGFSVSGGEGPRPASREGLAAQLSVEQFKLRDVNGRVIGLAARHRMDSADGSDIAWLVSIPSRGALMLADSADSADTLTRALARSDYVEGAAWQGDASFGTVTAGDGGTAGFSAGTAEFADLEIGFSEQWSVTGVDARGTLRGTIELSTVSRHGS